jgi:hypothetical protein
MRQAAAVVHRAGVRGGGERSGAGNVIHCMTDLVLKRLVFIRLHLTSGDWGLRMDKTYAD